LRSASTLPIGALTYDDPGMESSGDGTVRIKVTQNGPYRVTGASLLRIRPIYNEGGDGLEWERQNAIDHEETYDLCRCGASGTKPFCDGSEKEIDFDGSETADRGSTADRRRTYGTASFAVTDDRSLCAHMGFCSRGSVNVWSLAPQCDDTESRRMVIEMIRRCPSGRLQYALGPDAPAEEEDLASEIAVVDGGPLWVRGGIPVEASDGFQYEVRNRVALCRCGHSKKKPFCDGSHWEAGFTDP
jgi:CDGSH-type Zn-finger protein